MFKTSYKVPNFWNSYEIDCISRDFCYNDYVHLHEKYKFAHTLLHETSYTKLREIFNDEFEYDKIEKSSTNT